MARAIAVSDFTQTSLLRDAPVFPGLGKGSLSFSHQLEDWPTASLSIEGIHQNDLPSIRQAYAQKKEYSFLGYTWEVLGYGDQRERITAGANIYSIQVQFQLKKRRKFEKPVKVKGLTDVEGWTSVGAIADRSGIKLTGRNFYFKVDSFNDPDTFITVADQLTLAARAVGGVFRVGGAGDIEILPLDNPQQWTFPAIQIVDEGMSSETLRPRIERARLTGGFEDPQKRSLTTVRSSSVEVEPPVILELTEEDEDPEQPPSGTTVLKGLDSNADMSGPTKTRRTRTTVNGTPERDEVWVYGFAYTSEDLDESEEDELYSSTPASFWRIIEYRVTTYRYEKPQSLVPDFWATDPSDPGRKIEIAIHPDSDAFLKRESSYGLSVKGENEYLIEETTTGWQWTRYLKESNEDRKNKELAEVLQESPDSQTQAEYELYKFFKNPLESVTRYRLAPDRATYKDGGGMPFQVEWVKVSELTNPELIGRCQGRTTASGYAAVAKFDSNYVEPYFVKVESKLENSFAYKDNPANLELTTQDIADGEKKQPPYVVGKEAYYRTERTILPSDSTRSDSDLPSFATNTPQIKSPDIYSERRLEFAAQDAGFANSVEKVSYADIGGRPPGGTVRKNTIRLKTPDQPEKPKTVYKYTASGGYGDPDDADPSKSFGYPDLMTIEEAINAVETELTLEDWRSLQRSITVSWFYPQIKPGDRVVIQGRDIVGRVTGVELEIKYEGNTDGVGLLAYCESGTRLTLGRDSMVTVTYTKEPDLSKGGSGGIKSDFDADTDPEIGSIVNNWTNRRNF